jgi:GT2 family glycosyltransferase
MPKVSIIYPTARFGGLDILEYSLLHQTFQDFEVLVVDELRRKEIIDSLGWIYVEPPPKKPSMWWNLDSSLNTAIRQSKGEIIIQINDYVYVPPDGIQKFLDRHSQEPKALISGVSDQYLAYSPDNPTGLFSIWNSHPMIPQGEKVFSDPRKESTNKGFYITIPLLFEGNWCAYPKQAWIDIGGYDEAFDIGWGYDNVEFAERATFYGYHVFLDTENEVYCYSHINLFDEQKRRDLAPNNNQLYNKLSRMWYQGLAPTKLTYA